MICGRCNQEIINATCSITAYVVLIISVEDSLCLDSVCFICFLRLQLNYFNKKKEANVASQELQPP